MCGRSCVEKWVLSANTHSDMTKDIPQFSLNINEIDLDILIVGAVCYECFVLGWFHVFHVKFEVYFQSLYRIIGWRWPIDHPLTPGTFMKRYPRCGIASFCWSSIQMCMPQNVRELAKWSCTWILCILIAATKQPSHKLSKNPSALEKDGRTV